MKKFKNLGQTLTKAEQKTINGSLRDSSGPVGTGVSGGSGGGDTTLMQCCNQWGCGTCFQGKPGDCEVHNHGSNNEVYEKAC